MSGATVNARPASRVWAVGDVLIALGVLALAVAAIVSVARRALFSSDAFADRVSESLADPRVAAFLADRIAGAVVEKEPDLIGFRPIIVGTARGAVTSESFRALVRTAARAAHAGLFSEGGRTVIVSVPDVGVLLRSALQKANPALAEKIPARVQGLVASLGQGPVERVALRLWALSRRTLWLGRLLGVIGVALVIAGVVLVRNPRRAIGVVGVDLLVAGIVLFLLGPLGRAVARSLVRDELARGAAAGLWDAFTGPLRLWALVLGGTGLVLTAASHSLAARFDPIRVGAALVAWLERPPGGRWEHVLRGLVLIAVGTFALLRPGSAALFAVMLLGGAVAFVGLREVFEIALASLPVSAEAAAPSEAGGGWRLRTGVVLGVAAVLIAAILWIGRPPARAVTVESGACNGAPELCGRRVDQVVFPGTHNSMSAVDIPDWLFPQQERGIRGQLDDGIRALLFDVHYGVPVEGRVKTDLDAEGTSREKFEQAVGKEGLDAAMRIRDRLTGKEEGPRGLYLCHGFCELGAQPLGRALDGMHEFLVDNPDEVLLLVIEDYVSPRDLAASFAESGLDGLVYRGTATPPWPTLREMIDSRQRVIVLTESGRPGVPWIHPAFAVMQETPYRFKQPSELSCAVNRGGTAGSLFLMNNWIDTTPAPRPSNAGIVNAYDALLARARECQAERGRLPTVIAVDFYRTGALFRVVRALNGLPS